MKALFTGRKRAREPRGTPGKRLYAIGDVHGCADLLERLLADIEADNAARKPKDTALLMLGDLIDRGPNSRGVIERLLDRPPAFATLFNLRGNHEEMLVRGLHGEPDLLEGWLQHGGYQCVQSYGVPIGDLFGRDAEMLHEIIGAAIPEAHVEFLSGFLDSLRFGDYLFVHAGVRPGLPLEKQSTRDLRWIREPFLSSTADHGHVVVHGHTITASVEERKNRIGLDTGAYETGVLTAMRIEDEDRDYLSVSDPSQAVQWSRTVQSV